MSRFIRSRTTTHLVVIHLHKYTASKERYVKTLVNKFYYRTHRITTMQDNITYVRHQSQLAFFLFLIICISFGSKIQSPKIYVKFLYINERNHQYKSCCLKE